MTRKRPGDLPGSGSARSPSQPTSTAPGALRPSGLQVCHLISSRLRLFQTNTTCAAGTEGNSRRTKKNPQQKTPQKTQKGGTNGGFRCKQGSQRGGSARLQQAPAAPGAQEQSGHRQPHAAVVGFTGTPWEPCPSPRRRRYLPSSSPHGNTSSGGSTGIGCGGAGRSGSRGWTCGQDRADEVPAKSDAMSPGGPCTPPSRSATHLLAALGQNPSPPSAAPSSPAAAVPRRPPACRHRRSQAATQMLWKQSDFLQQGLPVCLASDAQGCRKAGETPKGAGLPSSGTHRDGCRGATPRVPARGGGEAAERPPGLPARRARNFKEFQLFPTGPGLPPRC